MCCLYYNTQFGMSLLFSELIYTQQEVKLFGPAFSRTCIFSRPGWSQILQYFTVSLTSSQPDKVIREVIFIHRNTRTWEQKNIRKLISLSLFLSSSLSQRSCYNNHASCMIIFISYITTNKSNDVNNTDTNCYIKLQAYKAPYMLLHCVCPSVRSSVDLSFTFVNRIKREFNFYPLGSTVLV